MESHQDQGQTPSHEHDINPNPVATEQGVKKAAIALVKEIGRAAGIFFFGTAEEQSHSKIGDIDDPPIDSGHDNARPETIPGKTTRVADPEHLKRRRFFEENSLPIVDDATGQTPPEGVPKKFITPGVIGPKKRDELRRLY